MYFIYLVLVCPEVEAKRKTSTDSCKGILNTNDEIGSEVCETNTSQKRPKRTFLKKYIVSPLIFALEVLRKPRHPSTKRLVYIQIFNCTLYWFVMEEQNMLFFYMARRFDDFNGTDFAMYTMTIKVNLKKIEIT